MSFVDPSASLLATCGGDTVKLFDVSVDSGDPCVLSCSPSPGSQVNCVKWNHTNLVVATAGDDKKISLFRKNGQSIGTVHLSGSNSGDDLEETVATISFSNKSSRYLCSGGSGRIVRIWDLQRKRCIKWLRGHADTITGVVYNCKDEHLASISMKGDLIIHNLASGARTAELKDPIGQVLRALDYSRLSRHILVTAGDDGSVHLWDTTGRGPKVSWLKQHSAPVSGVCFSPSSDNIIASVGLDKKLYTFDSGSRKPTSCIPYEAPFSSLAYSGDGNVLAAGTNSGRVVFYDVRGKPQPFTVLRAYNSSEAVSSLCWQRLKPVVVNENNCSAEIALLGGINEDSVLMPDPLPSTSVSSFSLAATFSSSSSSLVRSTSESISSTSCLSEETPLRSRLWPSGSLSKLRAPRSDYNVKDDMDVFSPLVDVQPITPSLGNWWDDNNSKTDTVRIDKNSSMMLADVRRFPSSEGIGDPHPISDWRSTMSSKQDGELVSEANATPVASLKSESSSSLTPPEAWGGDALPNKSTVHQQPIPMLSRFPPHVSVPCDSTFAGLQDTSSSICHSTINSLTSARLRSSNLQSKVTFDGQSSSTYSESSSVYGSRSLSTSLGNKAMPLAANFEFPGAVPSTLPRKFSTFAERISTTSTFSDGIGSATGSPKSKKTGLETREELLNSTQPRQDSLAAAETGSLPAINGPTSQPPHALGQATDQQQGGSSFSLQLVQRTLEETLGSVQKAIHEDVRNLHIELIRQFHMQETEMSSLLNSVLEKQDELTKEVQSLRRENQQLRQLL